MNVKLICLLFALVLVFGCTSFFDANECYDYHGHKSMTSSPDGRYIITQHSYSYSKLVTCVFDEDLNLVKNITAYKNFLWINDTTFVIDMNGSKNCLNSQYCLWIQDIDKSTPDKIIDLPINESLQQIVFRPSYDRRHLLVNFAYNPTLTYYQPGTKIPIWDEREYDWYSTVIDIENAVILDTMNESVFDKEVKQINCSGTDIDQCNSYIFSLDGYGLYGYGDPAISHDRKNIAIIATSRLWNYRHGNSYDDYFDYITIYSLEESKYSKSSGITIYSIEEKNQIPTLVKTKKIDIDEIGYSGDSINKIEFSPDDRYIAISGTYSISYGPAWGQISGLGYVVVVDTQTEKIVFRDDGGSLSGANYAHFAWSQDGKLLYLFDGETIREIHKIDPENPVKEKQWWEIF
ncbi:MAG: hypothetical protein ABIJ10_02080 [Candidatus Micrarchaeota archaeon]